MDRAEWTERMLCQLATRHLDAFGAVLDLYLADIAADMTPHDIQVAKEWLDG